MNCPIVIEKDGKEYPATEYKTIPTPFIFRNKFNRIFDQYIGSDVEPLFFKRQRMEISKNKLVNKYLHRYGVGYKRDNELRISLFTPEGNFDKLEFKGDK